MDTNKKQKFELKPTSGVVVSESILLDDLRRVSREQNKLTVSIPLYQKYGQYDPKTISRRFGYWNEALRRAGLEISNEIYITKEKLLGNIEQLWIKLGRQPTKRDLVQPLSEYSEYPYRRQYGSWRKALEDFIRYINKEEQNLCQGNPISTPEKKGKHKTKRDISLRLRFIVMKRDDFKCRVCGRNPATTPGLELHIDHIKPYSKGGETIPENLQTLCKDCNLGKSNMV